MERPYGLGCDSRAQRGKSHRADHQLGDQVLVDDREPLPVGNHRRGRWRYRDETRFAIAEAAAADNPRACRIAPHPGKLQSSGKLSDTASRSARGDYIVTLDADLSYAPGRIGRLPRCRMSTVRGQDRDRLPVHGRRIRGGSSHRSAHGQPNGEPPAFQGCKRSTHHRRDRNGASSTTLCS